MELTAFVNTAVEFQEMDVEIEELVKLLFPDGIPGKFLAYIIKLNKLNFLKNIMLFIVHFLNTLSIYR